MNKTNIAAIGLVATALFIGSASALGMFGGYGGYGPGMMGGYYGAPTAGTDGTVTPVYGGYCGGYGAYGCTGTGYNVDALTDEQKATIEERIRELQDEGALPRDIHGEVWNLLEEFGVVSDTGIDADGDGNPDYPNEYGRGYGGGGGCGMRGAWR